jgi:hypothetical protein
MDKKPDSIVWNSETGYDAKSKSYPTNISAPAFTVPDVAFFRTLSSKKMIDVFERERQEIVDKIDKLKTEYEDSVLVWESKISFEPIINKVYHLYNFGEGNILSLISTDEWNKIDFFIGSFFLNPDNKWIRVK